MEVNVVAAEVESTVQDAQYDDAWAITKFNEVLYAIAETCYIPGLAASAPVTAAAGGNNVAMPSTYLRGLYQATTPTYPRGLIIRPNVKELRKEIDAVVDPVEEGCVQLVAVDSRTLHFRPTPVLAETITLFFYGYPVELEAGDEFPDYIPTFLQKEIFLNYALKEAYLKIEDGIDGSMVNTQKYGSLAGGAIEMLKRFYPDAPKARVDVVRYRTDF